MEEALEWVDWLTVELMPEADTEDATPEADVDADADADTVDDVEADIAIEDEVCRQLRTPYQRKSLPRSSPHRRDRQRQPCQH